MSASPAALSPGSALADFVLGEQVKILQTRCLADEEEWPLRASPTGVAQVVVRRSGV